MVIFNRAISEPVRYALSLVEAPTSLDALVERAIQVDNRIREQGGDGLANKNEQQFLGFANFYRCFIRNFSSIAAPIVALTKKERHSHFSWNLEAEKAQELNQSWSGGDSDL